MVETPFVVVLEDDFVFTQFTDLRKMMQALVADASVDIVGGGLTKGGFGSPDYESYGLHLKLDADS